MIAKTIKLAVSVTGPGGAENTPVVDPPRPTGGDAPTQDIVDPPGPKS